ncbi:protein of unknown function (plasmid) [Cupriavidus taiwanensis]|uniref:Uncharacterized protein n=1 Tax=Cupriavidus taiwanensis TaxID=164546 RepID=A0A9Q7XQJ0_9BURK|nr:protein of unknown function [Cupriavidus taiwanensis]
MPEPAVPRLIRGLGQDNIDDQCVRHGINKFLFPAEMPIERRGLYVEGQRQLAQRQAIKTLLIQKVQGSLNDLVTLNLWSFHSNPCLQSNTVSVPSIAVT